MMDAQCFTEGAKSGNHMPADLHQQAFPKLYSFPDKAALGRHMSASCIEKHTACGQTAPPM